MRPMVRTFPVPLSCTSTPEIFCSSFSCTFTFTFEPFKPCSSPVNSTNRIVRFGFTPSSCSDSQLSEVISHLFSAISLRPADGRFATIAAFPLAPVGPMVPLIFSWLAFRVKKIGNRRSTQHNRFLQNVSQNAAQCFRLFPAQLGSEPRRMNLRFPQTLIRIDISDAAQHALVQQQRLDPRASPANPVRKFHLAHFERIGAESGQLFGKQRFRQVSNAPKTPRIGVAQFAPIIQKYANVSVLLKSSPRRTRRDLAGHSQMYQQ